MSSGGGPALDRSRPPEPGEPRVFRFPAFSRTRLATGLEVLAAPLRELPVATVRLLLPAGGQYQPLERPGLASLTAEVLDEGTESRSALEVAAAIEELGGQLDSGASWDVAWVSTGFLASYLEEALALLAEVARTPTFPAGEVERLRTERLTDLSRRRDRASTLADDVLLEIVYRGTVYERPLVGRSKSVAGLGRDDLLTFFRGHSALGGSILIAAGDLDPDGLLAMVGEAFAASEPPASAPQPLPIEPAPLAGLQVVVVDRPEAPQTELRLGHAGISRSHPVYLPARVMNLVLGGKFTSRLNLNLRERHHITYGARSAFASRRGPGPFTVAAAVDTASTGLAAREVLAELRRLQEDPVGTQELDDAKSFLLGVMPYALQTVDGVAAHLEQLAVHGLPDDYYRRLPEEIQAITPDRILEAARQLLFPDRIAVVAAGPAGELEPQLAELGEVEVRQPRKI